MDLKNGVQSWMLQTQGRSARALDRLPNFVKNSLAKALGYPYHFPNLDPMMKCLMAIQHKQGKAGFIGYDVARSRKAFEFQMKAIADQPKFVKKVENIQLNLAARPIAARHYHPQPEQSLAMVVFYHGGGFVVGSLDSHDEACRLLARHAKVQVLSN